MTAPSTSELSFYTNKRLTDKDWVQNFTQVVKWLTGAYDLSAASLTTTGDITAGGKITAGLGFYGDGSNLTGVGGGGSSAGVGISQVEQLTESSKRLGFQLPSSLTNIISEPFLSGANFTGTLTGDLAQGSLTIAITPTVTGQEPPKNQVLIITRASDGVTEEVILTGGSGGTYTLATSIQTASGFATSDAIRRNFCNINIGSNAEILSGQSGTSTLVQTHIGGQIDAGSRTNAVIDWSTRILSSTQGFKVDSIAASPTNIIFLQSTTDRTGEFSGTAPYNKIILTKVSENGQKGLYQIGNGREYTISSVGAFSASKIPVTVSDTYNDMDTNNVAAIGGVTGITSITGDGLTYWMASLKTCIPKLSFVANGVNESFVEVIPKKASYQNIYNYLFTDNFNYSDKQTTGSETLVLYGGWSAFSNTTAAAGSTAGFKSSAIYLYTNTNDTTVANDVFRTMDFSIKSGIESTTIFNISAFKNAHYWGVVFGGVSTTYDDNNNTHIDGIYINFLSSTTTDPSTVSMKVGDTTGELGAVNVSLTAATNYYRKIQITTSTIRVKVWAASGAEPVAWNISVSRSTGLTYTGTYLKYGTAASSGSAGAVTITVDTLTIKGLSAGLILSGTESNKTGQLATFRTDIVQASVTITNPSIEAKNLIVSGGIV